MSLADWIERVHQRATDGIVWLTIRERATIADGLGISNPANLTHLFGNKVRLLDPPSTHCPLCGHQTAEPQETPHG